MRRLQLDWRARASEFTLLHSSWHYDVQVHHLCVATTYELTVLSIYRGWQTDGTERSRKFANRISAPLCLRVDLPNFKNLAPKARSRVMRADQGCKQRSAARTRSNWLSRSPVSARPRYGATPRRCACGDGRSQNEGSEIVWASGDQSELL